MKYDPTHIGRNIRRIRQQQNISQTELGRRVGMFPAPINNIENGKNLPSATVLCKISEVLNVTLDTLFRDNTPSPLYIRETAPHYSTQKSHATPISPYAVIAREDDELKEINPALLADLSQVVDTTLTLEDITHAQKFAEIPLDLPIDISETGLSELCNRLRTLLGVSNAVVFDYLELLENAGLRLIFIQHKALRKSIGCHDPIHHNVFIFINQNLPTETKLFRILYEMGRILIKNNIKKTTTRKDYRKKPLTPDRAARRLAALFLMPETAVRKTTDQLAISPNQWNYQLLLRIKHRFGISAETFLYRLHELKLITTPLRNSIKEQIDQYYQKHNYAEPDGTKRILTPNARLGDLLQIAKEHKETPQLKITFKQLGVKIETTPNNTKNYIPNLATKL